MAARPVVSIVTALYNKAPYVAATARTVLDQARDFPDFEWVVVDDGSTDGSAEQLPDDPRIRLVRQENAGMAAAMNHGVACARGEFVTFVDADDALLPGKLAAQAKVLRAHPDHDWVVSGFVCQGGRHHGRRRLPLGIDAPRGGVVALDDAWTGLEVKGQRLDALLLRRGVFEAVGGLVHDATPFDHAHFFSRLLLAFPRGVAHQDVVSRYDADVPGSLFKQRLRRFEACRAMAELYFTLAERHPRHRDSLRRRAERCYCMYARGIGLLGERRRALRELLFDYRGPRTATFARSVGWIMTPENTLQRARRARTGARSLLQGLWPAPVARPARSAEARA